jgi:serine/threonine protein kinase
VQNTKNECLFVAKQVRPSDPAEHEEYATHDPYHCPSIARVVGISISPSAVFLFRSFVSPARENLTERTDVGSLLAAGVRFDNTALFIIAIGVALALAHIHVLGGVHGNVRSSNVLLDPRFYPFVVGYGVSATARARQGLDERARGESSMFCAPEVCEEELFGAEADMFAFGTLLYALHGAPLPPEDRRVRQMIVEGSRPKIKGVGAPYADLINRCWAGDPAERPTADAIVQELLSPRFKTLVKHAVLAQYLKLFREAIPASWGSASARPGDGVPSLE